MTRGTIVRNMYQPEYESYFVYRFSEKGMAHGISWISTEYGEEEFRWDMTYPKEHIMKDREHFPIVGYLNVEQLLKNHIKNEVSRYTKRILVND